MISKTTTSAWQKVALVLFGLVLSLAILEMGMRVGGFALLAIQDYANWRALQRKNTCRILCLGESTTQGQYPEMLERVLNERNIGMRFSVIDKGRAAANTNTLLRHLAEDLTEFQPDMVIAMMGINDRGIGYYQGILTRHTWIFEHCLAYKFLQILWMNFLKKIQREDLRRLNDAALYMIRPTRGGQGAIGHPLEARMEKSSLRSDVSNDYFLSGQRLAKQGKYLLAKNYFERSITLNPENDDAYVDLGRLYFWRLNEPALAEDFLRQALKINPHNDGAFYEFGWINFWQGEWRIAERFFKKSLEFNPKNDRAYVGLGMISSQTEISQAEDYFKKALELNPKNFRAVLGLGEVCSFRGEISKAESFYKKALELNPGNFSTRSYLATIYRRRGEFAQARDLFEKTTGLDPENNQRRERALASIDCELDKSERDMHRDEKEAVWDSDYSVMTLGNYHKLKETLERKGIKLVCVQYPMRSVAPLKKIFENEAGVVFVDNEDVFRRAVKADGYTKYFSDMFAGDFGHCTGEGNQLLAQNIADVILKEVLNKR